MRFRFEMLPANIASQLALNHTLKLVLPRHIILRGTRMRWIALVL